jgi:hypothetical protein
LGKRTASLVTAAIKGTAFACLFVQKQPSAPRAPAACGALRCMVLAAHCAHGERDMAWANTADDGGLEECLDELTELIERLHPYPSYMLAVALRVHLETLLQVLLDSGQCTRAEVRDFLRELEREALQYGES